MGCEECREQLYGFLHDTLPPEPMRDVRGHLATCESCMEAYRQARAQIGILQVVRSLDPPDPRGSPVAGGGGRRWTRWMTAVFGLMILCLAGAFLGLSYQGTMRTIEERFLRRLDQAIHLYRAERGAYPPANRPLVPALREVPAAWDHLGKEIPHRAAPDGRFLDRWGRPIRYTFPGRIHPAFFDLVSAGRDGADENGEGDDLTN